MVFFLILQLYFEKWSPEILIQIFLGNFATFVFRIRTNLWTKRSKLVLAENQVATITSIKNQVTEFKLPFLNQMIHLKCLAFLHFDTTSDN